VEKVMSTAVVSAIGSDWSRLSGAASFNAGTAQLLVRTVGLTAVETVLVDDASLRQVSGPGGILAGIGYLTLALIDPQLVDGDTHMRVSFEHLGTTPLPNTLRFGVFCDSATSNFAVNETKVTVSTDAIGTGRWAWARVAMPDLDRIQGCDMAEIRAYSPTFAVNASDVGAVSILRVLSGLNPGGN
jgi:hypothetical protein